MAIDIPIARTIYFGLDNKAVGVAAGEVLADWINAHWDGKIDKTLVVAEYRLLEFFQQRFTCAVDVLEEQVPGFSRDHTLYIDNGGTPEVTAERVEGVLSRWAGHRHIAVVCMNDDVAVGTLWAIHKLKRAGDVALLSHDGTHVTLEEFQRPAEDRAMVVSTLLKAEIYGQRLIELAVKMARREPVEQWNYVETFPITPENFREHVTI
jgi:ABC-type sugar transport system substrate-binding protein